MSEVASSDLLPPPEPPAFPIRVLSRTVWVAIGPFGLLYQSYANPDSAKGAVAVIVQRLHDLQKFYKVEALLDLSERSRNHFRTLEGLSDRWNAAEILFPSNVPELCGGAFFTAMDRLTLLPLSTGVATASELVLATDAEELRIKSARGDLIDDHWFR